MKNRQNKKTASDVLDPSEERLLRMREGRTVADDHPLQQMGTGHADTMAKLREMELEAFMATNRVDELRREAGVVAEKSDGPTKNKIISRLSEDDVSKSEKSKVAPAVMTNATNKKER